MLITGCGVKVDLPPKSTEMPAINENVNILNFHRSYNVDERPITTTPPEDLPEGIVEYDDNYTFEVRNDKTLTYIEHFPTEYKYTDISAIYTGDVPKESYENAYEWLMVLYEAKKLGSASKMSANIEHRYSLLNENCKEYVKNEFLNEHVRQMYYHADVENCALCYYGNYKVYFLGYKTKYIDFQNNEYYGITAQIRFDSVLYTKKRQVPYYLSNNDMGFSLYVEILFDSNHKIAGWQEQFRKSSEAESLYSKFVISPPKAGYVDDNPYFEEVFDESFGEPTITGYLKKQQQMFDIEKEIMYLLKDSDKFSEETFLPVKQKCSKSLVDSYDVKNFFDEFIYDISKYGVKFQFDPFTIEELDQKNGTQIKIYSDTKYGKVYSYSSGGLKKTGSDEFNKKYALGQEGRAFEIEYYFVEEDAEIKLLGIMLIKYNKEFSGALSDNLISLWNGIKPPVIEEEQG